MHPLSTYDVVLDFAIVVVMPLLIWVNLRGTAANSQYLWRESPNFMRVSLLVIGLLTLFSAVGLLGYYGLVPPVVVEYAAPIIGIPFLVVALAEIWLGVGALRKFLRTRTAGGTGA